MRSSPAAKGLSQGDDEQNADAPEQASAAPIERSYLIRKRDDRAMHENPEQGFLKLHRLICAFGVFPTRGTASPPGPHIV